MAADQTIADVAALKAAGASPREVCVRCLEAGVSQMEIVRALRLHFALTFSEAKDLLVDLKRPQTREEFHELLRSQLGYCDCASRDALEVLRDILRAAQDKVDRASDPEAFRRASNRIVELLGPEGHTGVGEWFVYFLESRELLSHGFRASDLYILDAGRELLRAIDQFGGLGTPEETADG